MWRSACLLIPADTTSRPGLGPAMQTVHVFTLVSLALAVRLYEVLGRQPAFFAVRQAHRSEVILATVALSLLLPAVLAAGLALAGRRSVRLQRLLYATLVLLAMTAIALPPLKTVAPASGLPVLAIAAAMGLAAAAAYFRFKMIRAWLTILCPSVLLAPAIFLTISPAARMLAWTAEPPLLDVKVGRPAPVVLIVLDEFSGISLMDREHGSTGAVSELRRAGPRRPPGFATPRRCRRARTTPCRRIFSGEHPHGPLAPPVDL